MPAAVACVVSLALMPLAVHLGRSTGLVDHPGKSDLTIHDRPISVLGGPAAVVAIFAGLASAGIFPVGAAIGVGLGVAVGLVDDVRPVSPWVRLVVLALAGAITGQAMGGGPVSIAVGIVLGLACSNALNIVDGQDGLAGGLSLLIALSMGAASASLDGDAGAAIGLATVGALLAFLLWNRPPASIFLGNGGVYGIGMLLAAQATELVTSGLRGTIAAGICLGYLAFEVLLTVLRRIRSGAGVLSGDRRHSYDLLAARLHSRPRATLLLWVLQAALGFLGIAASTLSPAAGIPIAASLFVLAAIGAVALGRGSEGSSPARRPRSMHVPD